MSSADGAMHSEPFARIGRVTKTHGLKGEVSVATPTETSLSVLIGMDVWFVPPPATVRTAVITSTRNGPRGTLVSLEGVSDIDTARSLVGRDMMIRSDQLPTGFFVTAPEEETFDGFSVFDEEHGLLGEIVETIITGANDVWVVHGPLGEVLIPVIDQVVLAIDESAQTIRVLLLDGLLDGEE